MNLFKIKPMIEGKKSSLKNERQLLNNLNHTQKFFHSQNALATPKIRQASLPLNLE